MRPINDILKNATISQESNEEKARYNYELLKYQYTLTESEINNLIRITKISRIGDENAQVALMRLSKKDQIKEVEGFKEPVSVPFRLITSYSQFAEAIQTKIVENTTYNNQPFYKKISTLFTNKPIYDLEIARDYVAFHNYRRYNVVHPEVRLSTNSKEIEPPAIAKAPDFAGRIQQLFGFLPQKRRLKALLRSYDSKIDTVAKAKENSNFDEQSVADQMKDSHVQIIPNVRDDYSKQQAYVGRAVTLKQHSEVVENINSYGFPRDEEMTRYIDEQTTAMQESDQLEQDPASKEETNLGGITPRRIVEGVSLKAPQGNLVRDNRACEIEVKIRTLLTPKKELVANFNSADPEERKNFLTILDNLVRGYRIVFAQTINASLNITPATMQPTVERQGFGALIKVFGMLNTSIKSSYDDYTRYLSQLIKELQKQQQTPDSDSSKELIDTIAPKANTDDRRDYIERYADLIRNLERDLVRANTLKSATHDDKQAAKYLARACTHKF